MVDEDNKSSEWKRYLFALSSGIVLSSLSLLRADVPRIAFTALIFGCLTFMWLILKVSAQWLLRVRIFVVLAALAGFGYLIYLVYPARSRPPVVIVERRREPLNQTVADGTHPKLPVQEVTVVFYNDSNVPEFSVDGRLSAPVRYESGIAIFRLSSGTHSIRAEYSTRTCSLSVFVPLQGGGPVAANCGLKKVEGV